MGADTASTREVVIGRNSTIWRALSRRPVIAQRFPIALSHRDVGEFQFTREDRVWIFAYSNEPRENEVLLEAVVAASPAEIVYVSTATANVARLTRCYRYPYVKALAEQQARALADARILTLGMMFDDPRELPAGNTMATAYDELAAFLAQPRWPADRHQPVLLFNARSAPFSGIVERGLFAAYGFAIGLCAPWPCLLRPVDALLRSMGYRWYGYVFLSNRLWSTTTS